MAITTLKAQKLEANSCGLKLTVLVDNNTLTQLSTDYYGEPGVCYYIGCGDRSILFDVGNSDLFIQNARKMFIDLRRIDAVVLSHGHHDHTWGLVPFIQMQTGFVTQNFDFKRPVLISHPLVFQPKIKADNTKIGSIITSEEASRRFDLRLSKSPIWLNDQLVYLGEIERSNNFEGLKPIGSVIKDEGMVEDFLYDDSAIAYKSPDGLIIITGCSHSGICNIIEHAKRICNEERVIDVIGGFHLLNPSENQLERTVNYFKQLQPKVIHPCHCTGLKSTIALAGVVNVEEAGVGLQLEFG